jgi:hypothetical protein
MKHQKPHPPEVVALLKYICDTPELLSLLYDIGMLPEQLRVGSEGWRKMILITAAWREAKK